MNSNLQQLTDILSSPRRVVITTHRDPDADALGSSLGWSAWLSKYGHDVSVISPTAIPDNLRWLPGAESAIVYEESERTRLDSRQIIHDADYIFCLDFSALGRLKDLGKVIQNASAPKVLIDHHIDPEPFSILQFWDVEAPATAFIIYQIIRELAPEDLNSTIAECLYAGIMTDTGSFRHSNTTPETHLAVADLMRTGFDASRVHRLIFDSSPLSRLQLLGHALSGIQVLPEFRTSYMMITQSELEQFQSSVGDTEGIVNYGLQVANVVMTALFIERRGEIKISFRSSGDFSVRDLSNRYFSGGGHRNAAGGRSPDSLQQTIARFLQILPEYQEELMRISN